MGVHNSHPGRISVALAPPGLLIGKPSQPSQMVAIGTGVVSFIGGGQLSGNGCGHGRFEQGGTDVKPGLEMARAGVKYDTGLMPIGPHAIEGGGSP